MNDLDKHGYERLQNAKRSEASDALRELPAYKTRVDVIGRGPVVLLTCPRGHPLIPVRSDAIEDRVELQALPDRFARKSGRITEHAEPWRHGKRVCPRPNCGAMVDHDGYCDDHGGRDVETIGSIRTRFTCHRSGCRWSQPITTARLLTLYAAAIVLGRTSIPLGDTPHGHAMTHGGNC